MDLIVDFPSPNARPPRVAFADHYEMRVVENLTLEHKGRLWFSGEEMDVIQQRTGRFMSGIVARDMTMAQFAEMNVHDTSTFLGLERYLSIQGVRDIRFRRRAIWRAVRLEQQRQTALGVCDPEAMAILATKESEISKKRARIIGLLHASKDT